jgi:hypothetical protein
VLRTLNTLRKQLPTFVLEHFTDLPSHGLRHYDCTKTEARIIGKSVLSDLSDNHQFFVIDTGSGGKERFSLCRLFGCKGKLNLSATSYRKRIVIQNPVSYSGVERTSEVRKGCNIEIIINRVKKERYTPTG